MSFELLPASIKKVLRKQTPPLDSIEKLTEYKASGNSWRDIEGIGEAHAKTLDDVLRGREAQEGGAASAAVEGETAPVDGHDTAQYIRDIFISHRHEDAKLAAEFKEELLRWGVSQHRIFLSSDARSGAKIGEALDEELKKAVAEARLLFLIYTSGNADWSWCVYEIGLATAPEAQNTHVVCVKCTNDSALPMIKSQVVVKFTAESFRALAFQFHKTDDFIPGTGVLDHDIADHVAEARGQSLYEALKPYVPKSQERTITRWGNFTLGVDAETARILEETDELSGIDELDPPLEERVSLLAAEGWGIQHFGFDELPSNYTLARMDKRWRQDRQRLGPLAEGKRWLEEVREEIWRIVTQRPTSTSWTPFKSIRQEGADLWVCPVICQARVRNTGSWHFDVYVFRVPKPAHATQDVS